MDDESDVSRRLALAQLAHTQMENDKLELELAKQRKKAAWYQLPAQLVPLVTALLSVAGFLWGVVQYAGQQQKNRTDREVQSLREQETAERELMKPWLESQRAIYTEALSAAATAANSGDPKERSVAEQRFWQLLHGRMVLVETKSVSEGMVRFGWCLDRTETCDSVEMNERAHALASAMAESMAATAQMTYQEFSKNQFRYTPSPRKP